MTRTNNRGRHRKINRSRVRVGAAGLTAGTTAAVVLVSGGAAGAGSVGNPGGTCGQSPACSTVLPAVLPPSGARADESSGKNPGSDVEEVARAARAERDSRSPAASQARGADVVEANEASRGRDNRSGAVRPAQRPDTRGKDVADAAEASGTAQKDRNAAAAQQSRGSDVEEAAQTPGSAERTQNARVGPSAERPQARPASPSQERSRVKESESNAAPAAQARRNIKQGPSTTTKEATDRQTPVVRKTALPRTGSSDLGLLAAGSALVGAGVGLVRAASGRSEPSRRRRGTHRRG